ncbi:claspin-like [Planococcus citri]|uniref:claspin-like n=1 Tax=Planococcus citri TaxID=170843 RepID=UPI0031FA148C
MSDSEEEVITRKPKTTKLFNSDDDESDNDKKSEKSSGFVDHSDDSQGSSKSLSSRNESDNEGRKAPVRNNKPNDSPVKSKISDSSDDERRSQPKKSRSSSSSSDDGKTPRSRKSSSSSSSSNQGKPSQSRKSRSNSSSSERSRSRKSSSSSSSSCDEKKSQSRKSRSSSSSSGDEKKSQSRKSRSSSSSSSDGKRSQSRKSRSSSSSSSDEKKTQSRKSRSSSSNSDDEIRPRLKKSGKKSSSSGDKKLSKSDSSDNETHSQSKRSNSSDNDSRSACSQISNKNNASDNEKSASSPIPTKADSNNAQQKSSGKYSLITASDLESEDDTRPVMNESMSDDDLRLKSNKKSKKLLKKKSTSNKKSAHSKSNGLSEAFDSSGSDDEETPSPKRVQKSAAKRKSETKTPKDSKASKKEKDPLLSIRSETQRMIREGRISLPYHQPKQRSLHEFLQRRKTAPSIPLKATPEVLRNVCEQLINKEKEVEDFYKSESDNSETEDQPSNLPETETEGANDTVKDIKSASTDLPVDKEAPAVEMELDKDTNYSTLTDNNESRNPPSDISEQNKDTNSTLIDDSPERVDPESNKNKDPVLEKSDESPSTENPTEPITTEENPTKPITEDGSNPQPTPKDDKIIPMDVDEDTHALKDSQDLVNITKSNESATEQVNERDMPDSEDFVLQIEDSCSNYTDDITKPSNLPAPEEPPSNEITKPSNPLASEMLPDSSDFELRIEDSYNNTETPTETVPASEAEKISSNSVESTSKPVISKDRLKNRIEALLSTRKIKLSSLNLNSALEPIQFEIPSFQPEPTGIRDLKEKFVKHSLAKKKPKSTPSQVNVVTTQTDTEGGVIGVSKETLTMSLNGEENEFSNPKLKVPGAKHAYLKKKMLDMLISKKEATWNEYQNEKRKYYGSDDEENYIDGDNDDDDAATCKKLNFEPYHPEDEPDDDELVEDDVVYEEKNRDKNCFVDEEADVSELEDEEDDNPAEQDDADNGEDDDDDDDDDKDSVDSDGLDFHVKDDSPSKPDQSNDNAESSKLFKYNTTGFDLEKKLLGLESISQTNLNDDVSASQIFGLCSGTFATQHQPRSNTASAANEDDDFFIDSQNAEDSQNICLSLPDTDNTVEKSTEKSNKDTVFKLNDTPEEEEEEEEEIFTRKKPTMRIVEDSDDETTEPTNEANADASDEDNGIDDQDEDEADGENIEDEEEGADEIEAEEFGYDSEEELVSYDKPSAREFFENEAELSESEWGSEDENEKDLDKLEKEEGDDDEIDADKLKEELGKIHMRQLLDDDQHDVRLLKEMLLEDGELHSDAKRQRKFQWKSLADGDDFFKNHSYDSDDEINLNDDDNDNDESEEHWRKIRHERETFLLQQEKKSKLNDTVTESVESTFASTKIIDESIVTKIVQRTSFSSTGNTSKDKPDQDLSKTNSKIKCGSFLSRGKLLLSKMTLSVSETKENLHGAKNSRNFVFGARSPKKEQVPVTVEKTEKRKSTSTSVSVPKKVRLSVDNETNPARRKGLLARLALTE